MHKQDTAAQVVVLLVLMLLDILDRVHMLEVVLEVAVVCHILKMLLIV